MTVLRRHHKQLIRRGAHTRAGMLHELATAQMYDGPRICEHNPAEAAQSACVLCGSPDDSMFQSAFGCPCLPASAELDKTGRLVGEEKEKAHACPIFWFRGLPPDHWYPQLPVTEDFIAENFGIIGGHVFSDESGGTETKDPRLRRYGYGVARVFANGGSLNTLGGRAGGKTHTVAKAELVAAVIALQLCARATQQFVIWTDCMFVVNSFASGRRRKHLSHASLWKEFWDALDAIGPPILIYKVWSHVTEAEIVAGLISPLEASGNEVADKLAAKGALRNALSLEFVAAVRHTDSRVRLVRTRLVEVNLLHVQNKPKIVRAAVKAPVRRTKFDPIDAMALLNRIGHDFSRTQIGKGRYTFECRLIRGDRLFLKRIQGGPCCCQTTRRQPFACSSIHASCQFSD